MPTFLIPLISIFAKYWKQFAVAGIIIGLVFTIYYKGKSDCAAKMEQEVNKEVARRIVEVNKVIDHTEHVDDQIDRDRDIHPQDDARDSCILSNNPYKVKCVQ